MKRLTRIMTQLMSMAPARACQRLYHGISASSILRPFIKTLKTNTKSMVVNIAKDASCAPSPARVI
jgi:hypothetical protein